MATSGRAAKAGKWDRVAIPPNPIIPTRSFSVIGASSLLNMLFHPPPCLTPLGNKIKILGDIFDSAAKDFVLICPQVVF